MMIQRSLILEITESFYEVATKDFLIGYHFRGIEDFDTHIPRIATFWEVQLNGFTDHKEELPFNLIKVHAPLGIKIGELGRWVVLFRQNLDLFVKKQSITESEALAWMKKVDWFEEKLRSRLIGAS